MIMDKKFLQILTLSAFTVLGMGSAQCYTLTEIDIMYEHCLRDGPSGCRNFQQVPGLGQRAVDMCQEKHAGKAGCDEGCKTLGRVVKPPMADLGPTCRAQR